MPINRIKHQHLTFVQSQPQLDRTLLQPQRQARTLAATFDNTQMIKKIFFSTILIHLFLTGEGQTNCSFKIDTLSILEDKNLLAFIEEINSTTFKIHKDKKHIPKFCKKQLDCLTNGFDIANPKEEFRNSCTASDSLPPRRLELLLTSKKMMILTYDLGLGASVTGIIMFCKFSKNKMTDMWTCTSWRRQKSKDDVIKYIQDAKKNNSILHSELMYF